MNSEYFSTSRRAVTIACALSLSGSITAFAQRPQQVIPAHPADPTVYVNARSAPDDPRTGLKGGVFDAESAISGLQLVTTVKKPGAFGPDMDSIEKYQTAPIPPPPAPGAAPEGRRGGGPRMNTGQTNSDLGFSGKYLFQGNYYGINIYDISDPAKIALKTSIVCPGGQGDVSVYGHLVFMSVETSGKTDCSIPPAPAMPPPGLTAAAPAGAGGRPTAPEVADPTKARGVRIFDISDIEHPKQVAMVQTCRGSHTHTLLTGTADKGYIYFYVAGSAGVRPAAELAGCVAGPDDPNTAVFTIVIVKVPLAHPEQAKIVDSPYIFSDPKSGSINGLWQGGTHGDNTETTSATRGCHDLTMFESQHMLAGACSGNGILLDISNPEKPVRLDAVTDNNFAFWHSANFSNDGKVVLFTDEWGGGGAPHCRLADPMAWGGDAIFEIQPGGKLKLDSYFKMPAIQEENKNCVAHNGSLIPVPGRNILVQSWYQGGIDMFDFTDPKHPYEIGYFTRGPMGKDGRAGGGGDWSSYYYNGYIYGSEMGRGTDVLKLVPTKYLTQNEIDAAAQVKLAELNVQDQPHFEYPKTFITAKAYIDQLVRDDVLTLEKGGQIDLAIDGKKTKELKAFADSLDKDAATAPAADVERMHLLAEILKKA